MKQMAVNWTMMIAIRQYKCNEMATTVTCERGDTGTAQGWKRCEQAAAECEYACKSSAYGLIGVLPHIYYNQQWIVAGIFCLFVCLLFVYWLLPLNTLIIEYTGYDVKRFKRAISEYHAVHVYESCGSNSLAHTRTRTLRHVWPKVWCESNGKSVAFS